MKFILRLFLFISILSISLSAITKRVVLSPEEAFSVNVIRVGDVLSVKIDLGKDVYLYSDKLKFEIIKPTTISLDNDIKKPEYKNYKEFTIYDKPVNILIPITTIKKYVSSGEFTLKIHYQGCAYSGICYQPLSKEFTFDLGVASTTVKADIPTNDSLSESDLIASTLANDNIWLVLLTFFGFGILLSLTPCVFPMIPILSSIIVSKKNMTTKKAFILSLVYVLAMSLAYTIAGVFAGLFGANIQAALQDPWIITIFSAVFVALSFSMFGFYEIQMPSFIQSKLTKKSDEMQSSGIVGVAVMGFLSALIMGPCVAAPLAGALIYIGQSGDALLGGAALFVMSMGMGLPLLAIGTGAGKYMPRPGSWMDSVKAIFGVIMLALAIWTLSRILSSSVIMLFWMFLVISSAVYLGALESLRENSNGWSKLIKSFAVIMFIYGIMLFIGAMTKSTNPLDPLAKFSSSSSFVGGQIVSNETPFRRVATLKELKTIISQSSKPVMLDFYADWCVSCVELENNTFSEPTVRKKLEEFTILQVDVTKNSVDDKELLNEFGVFGPPAIMFFREGKELKSKRLIGFKDAKEFLNHLNKIN